MKVIDLINSLGLEVYTSGRIPEKEITGGYVSDLLSDVMGNAGENQAWITLQTHVNIVAVASLKDIAAIILVKGLKPDQETLLTAEREEVLILGTRSGTYEMAGQLYILLKRE